MTCGNPKIDKNNIQSYPILNRVLPQTQIHKQWSKRLLCRLVHGNPLEFIYIYITLLYCSGAEDLLDSTERYKLPVKDIILPINKTISHGAIGTRKQGAVNLVSSTV